MVVIQLAFQLGEPEGWILCYNSHQPYKTKHKENGKPVYVVLPISKPINFTEEADENEFVYSFSI